MLVVKKRLVREAGRTAIFHHFSSLLPGGENPLAHCEITPPRLTNEAVRIHPAFKHQPLVKHGSFGMQSRLYAIGGPMRLACFRSFAR